MIQTDSPATELFEKLEYLVDDRVGIITEVGEFPVEPGGPRFFHFYGQACDTTAFTKQKNFATTGGASTNREIAMAKAVGEAVERYCSAIYDINDFPLSDWASAPFPCVSPDEFALYRSDQYARSGFPYQPFTPTTPVRWSKMFHPLSGHPWYVPASMVVMPYFYGTEQGEIPIAQPITTGLACHCSWERAAISAIGEVIERDAFTIAWQARMGVPKIAIQTLGPDNRDLVERFERTGHTVTILNITLDHGIPSIVSVIQHPSPQAPALLVAASADLNPGEAVRKSLEELAHTRRLALQLKASLPPLVPGKNHEHLVDQDSHIHVYCDQANTSLAEFLFSSDTVMDFQEIDNLSTGLADQDLGVYCDRIDAIHHRVLLADLTTPDVKDLGLWVARAVIPGFHPLCMGHPFRALGGTRLWTIPQNLGYPGITPATGDNPAAHPYP